MTSKIPSLPITQFPRSTVIKFYNLENFNTYINITSQIDNTIYTFHNFFITKTNKTGTIFNSYKATSYTYAAKFKFILIITCRLCSLGHFATVNVILHTPLPTGSNILRDKFLETELLGKSVSITFIWIGYIFIKSEKFCFAHTPTKSW